jgi:small subunit ribosomal protein S6
MDTGKHIYETIFVLHPELAEEEVEANIQNIVGLLEGKSSEIIRIERGGKRRLAYVVQKQRYGYYNLLHFHATPAALTELERLYRLSERVIRYLTVRFDKEEQLTGFARLADDDGQDEERDDRRRGGRRGDFFRPRPRGRETHRAADDLPEEDGDPEGFEEIAGRV